MTVRLQVLRITSGNDIYIEPSFDLNGVIRLLNGQDTTKSPSEGPQPYLNKMKPSSFELGHLSLHVNFHQVYILFIVHILQVSKRNYTVVFSHP
jgi:hypothetical protein